MKLESEEYQIKELLTNIYKLAKEQNGKKKIINSPDKAIIEATLLLDPVSQQEKFGAIFLNTKSAVIESEILFYGTVDQAHVYPRELFRRALQLNATTMVVCHNHPSGTATPSSKDEQLTTTLVNLGITLGLNITDHIIVATEGSISLRNTIPRLWQRTDT